MGRQAIIAALCWLTLKGTLAVNLVLKDSLSADSVKRLYRNVPYGVYASAAPYGAYSFPVPYVTSPKASASRVEPVKDNLNLYLKDSYGNRYVPSSQSLPLKPITPQQFLQLQALPSHFTQPISAAPLKFNYNQPTGTPHAPVVYGSHYKLPLQSAAAGTGSHYGYAQAHPGNYGHGIKGFVSPSVWHTPHHGSAIQIPGYSSAITFQHPATSYASQEQEQPVLQPTVQLQSNSNKAPVYSISSTQDPGYSISSTPAPIQYQSTKLPQFQRVKDSEEIYNEDKREAVRNVKANLKKTSSLITPVKTVVNGKKAVVNVETKPLVPLLDISLLEPLTFDNPLVPQVQHYLPRINSATYHKLSDLKPKDKKYHKEYVVQKTKSYDSGYKPKKVAPKRKHKRPAVEIITYDDEIPQASTARPTVAISDESPEISYEINSPNYKETYNEKAVKYNKETKPEPVHITYGTHTRKEPVTYTYVHKSKEPVHIKEVHYESNNGGPKKTKHEEQTTKEDDSSEDHSEESDDSSEENDTPHHHHHHQKHHSHEHEEHPHHHHHHHHSKPEHKGEEYYHHPKPEHREKEYHHQSKPEHREKEYHHQSKPEHRENEYHHQSQPEHREKEYHHQSNPEHREEQYHHHSGPLQNVNHQVVYQGTPPVQHFHVGFQPVAQYEEEIHLTAPIKVDPNQHIQNGHEHSEPRHQAPQSQQQAHPPQHHSHQAQHNEHHHSVQDNEHQHKAQYHPKHQSAPQEAPQPQKHQHAPPVHVQEKTKQVYIQQETPEEDEDDSSKETFIKDEDNEQDFEKAYKNAAFGFPAYNSKSDDIEKDIYNPDSYGVPRESSNYDIKNSPFQQYQEEGDDFPKTTRSNYMDARDKTKENYFLDFSINRPESLADRYTKKVDYLKLYNQQKPDKIFPKVENKKEKQSEKYSAIPYDFYPIKDQKGKQAFAHYTSVPMMEFDFSKGEKRDNSAFASRPLYTYKINTHFVEPQFQYGFEPIALPRLLDSELAAMATNNSPESEKPGMRKKIYKENFYIKKTSTSNEPSS